MIQLYATLPSMIETLLQHRTRFLLVCSLLGPFAPAGQAADPQPYTVDLKPTGNPALDGALHDTSSLISLQKTAPVGGFALVARGQQDLQRFDTALNSFGYYKGHAELTIDHRPVTDPALPDLIDRAPAEPPVPVEVQFNLGPQFHLGRVVLQGQVPLPARSAPGLETGAPARAADVLAAQQRLLTALRNNGYPLAKVNLPPVTLRPAENALDVTFDVQTGPRAPIGDITITGLKDMNESFVRQRLLIHTGDEFSAAAIEKARQDLASIGVFSVVRIEPADKLDAQGRLPLTVDVTERPKHAVDVGAGYSTDLGINFNVGWHDRNLFGNAEQLNLTGSVQLGGNALEKPGYQFNAQFIKPDFLARDQSLELNLG
ncbi:MAG: hypothetical protein JO227_24400, partial [Acetobacteraceae bacterium]|nr:hypothetical protein [Acetobacteraceae bacterium]